MTVSFKHIDLFAGCGGLSLGLKQAGFDLHLAVEKSPMAAETFYHNLIAEIETPTDWVKFSSSTQSVSKQASERLVVKPLSEVLACTSLLAALKSEDIDLVAGGPPCQGFSAAGRRDPDDARNKLAWEFLDFVAATAPKSVVIENVAGMRQGFKKNGLETTFEQLRCALEATGPGYLVQPMLLNAMHFGAPQRRPRVMLVGVRKDVAELAGLVVFSDTWRSGAYDEANALGFSQRPTLAPFPTTLGDEILTVKDAISDLTTRGYSVKKSGPSSFAQEMRTDRSWMPDDKRTLSVGRKIANQEVRQHTARVVKRFMLHQALSAAGASLKVISSSHSKSLGETEKRQQLAAMIENVKFPLKSPNGKVLAYTARELTDLILELATKKHSQRPLSWNQPSPTVLSLPDDFIHPRQPRTMTVREMARLQSFPDAFEFRSKVTTGGQRRKNDVPQYTQVGNAVPPKLAKALGLTIRAVLEVALQNKVELADREPTALKAATVL